MAGLKIRFPFGWSTGCVTMRGVCWEKTVDVKCVGKHTGKGNKNYKYGDGIEPHLIS